MLTVLIYCEDVILEPLLESHYELYVSMISMGEARNASQGRKVGCIILTVALVTKTQIVRGRDGMERIGILFLLA